MDQQLKWMIKILLHVFRTKHTPTEEEEEMMLDFIIVMNMTVMNVNGKIVVTRQGPEIVFRKLHINMVQIENCNNCIY